jgi:hypothetical protein
MAKKMKKGSMSSTLLVALAGLVLFGGTFAFASGAIVDSGSSLFASAVAAFSGRPVIVISRDSYSASGNALMGYFTNLATFDISAKNVTHWATVNYVSTQVTISSTSAAPLTLSNVTMVYEYCIPPGESYGYGWRSNGCASIKVNPSSLTKFGNGYTANFTGSIPVYPQQSYGAFTISAIPTYAYTGSAKNAAAINAKLVVSLRAVSAVGDQCQWAYNGLSRSYGYTNCAYPKAIIDIQTRNGNSRTIVRSYGYGYYPPVSASGAESASIDQSSLASTGIVTLTGSASNVQNSYGNELSISVRPSNGTGPSSGGYVIIKNGRWSWPASAPLSLPVNIYLVQLSDPASGKVLAAGKLIISAP